MKDVKELSGFLAKAFAVFLAMNLVVVLVYVGSLAYGNYRINHYEKYFNDLSQVESIVSNPIIDSLVENNYKLGNVVITTSKKDNFLSENIKTIEFSRSGWFSITVYYKGGFISLNPKWLIAHRDTVNDISVKYIHTYSNTFLRYRTDAIFSYNDTQYKISVLGNKEENINEIIDIIKAME